MIGAPWPTAAQTPAPSPAPSPAPGKPLVVATFSILGDFARQVAGDRAEIRTLIGPNSDTHVYRASPADAKLLKDANLIILNGLGLEGFMPRLIKSSGTRARVVTLTTGLTPLEKEKTPKAHDHAHDHGHSHDSGKADPHAWQSIEAVRLYVTNLRDGLSAVDAAGAAIYKANAEAYLAALSALKAELETAFRVIPGDRRLMITNHDAFRYFGQEFGFRIESVQGLSTESEPSAKDIARIIRIARERKARAVFLENMSDPRVGSQLAKETGAKLGGKLFSDALSDDNGPAPTYIAMMRHNAKMIIEALKE